MNPLPNGGQEAILRRIRDIPSLPEVVNRIILLLNEPNTPASEIAKLISYDPGLSSKVLRMVNSAAYGFQRQISSIQHGIMILGFNTVRGLVLSASILKMFESQGSGPQGLDHRRFWEHSLATALGARIMATSLRMPDADDAFSAGMLHDIGKVVLDVHFRRDYQQVMELARRKKISPHGPAFLAIEDSVLQSDHTRVGAFLATKWKLPVTIAETIQYHHAPQEAPTCQPLVSLVALANQLAILLLEHHGVYNRNFLSPDLIEYFGLSDEDMVLLLDRLQEDFSSAEQFFSASASA